MYERISARDCRNIFTRAAGFLANVRVVNAAVVMVIALLSMALDAGSLQAAANPAASSAATGGAAGTTIPLAESLGVHFVPGSSSQVLLDRDGKTYLVDLAEQTIQAKDSPIDICIKNAII